MQLLSGYRLGDLLAIVEVIVASVYTLSGFVAAVMALSFNRTPSGGTGDNSVQDAFNQRNAARRVMLRLLTFGTALLVLDALLRSVRLVESEFASAAYLAVTFVILVILVVLIMGVWRTFHAATILSANYTASARVTMTAKAIASHVVGSDSHSMPPDEPGRNDNSEKDVQDEKDNVGDVEKT
jgi:uncharacterized membrane protein YcjF (UPF0283 family)